MMRGSGATSMGDHMQGTSMLSGWAHCSGDAPSSSGIGDFDLRILRSGLSA